MLLKTIPYPNDDTAIYYSAPTVAEVVIWLHEKDGVWTQVVSKNTSKGMVFRYELKRFEWDGCITDDILYNSPSEAYKAAITYTLETLL
jgi:hypothetical protein